MFEVDCISGPLTASFTDPSAQSYVLQFSLFKFHIFK